MANLTDPDASMLVRLILGRLTELNATDVIAGIDESRRLGVEEPVGEATGERFEGPRRERKQLGTVRRRPLTDREILRLVLERLRQRLIVVPTIARKLQKEFQGREIVWRVDREFASEDRLSALEADLGDLIPQDVEAIDSRLRLISDMVLKLEREE